MIKFIKNLLTTCFQATIWLGVGAVILNSRMCRGPDSSYRSAGTAEANARDPRDSESGRRYLPPSSRMATAPKIPQRKKLHGAAAMRPLLQDECLYGYERCIEAIAERTVHLSAGDYGGTGFILSSNSDSLTVLTAAHVITEDYAGDSEFREALRFYDSELNDEFYASSACVFDKSFGSDVAIIKFPNPEGKIFFAPEIFDDGVAGEPILMVENRDAHRKKGWIFTIWGFQRAQMQIHLKGAAKPGMSGSAIFSDHGGIVGVFVSRFTKFDGSSGDYNISELIGTNVDQALASSHTDSRFWCHVY